MMINRRMFGLLLAAFSLAPSAFAQYDYNAGEAWNRMDRAARVTWLWGAGEGQSLIIEELSETPEQFENRIPADSADVIADVMTQYYEDAANTFIPWKYLAVIARMKLDGEAEAELTNRLESLREYAAWLREQ